VAVDAKKLRDRAWLYLSDEVAACAGMSLTNLQQFLMGRYEPTPEQLERLARRLNIQERETNR
jgi:hypothetical protein